MGSFDLHQEAPLQPTPSGKPQQEVQVWASFITREMPHQTCRMGHERRSASVEGVVAIVAQPKKAKEDTREVRGQRMIYPTPLQYHLMYDTVPVLLAASRAAPSLPAPCRPRADHVQTTCRPRYGLRFGLVYSLHYGEAGSERHNGSSLSMETPLLEPLTPPQSV
uniref:Uncharacterized protein n=1 Tax=Knipowitschia caucasica TaxID=637954 RepID=A0AAV2K8B0_KNICA